MGLCAVLALGVLVALLVSDIPHQIRRTITLTTLVAFGLFAVLGLRNRIRDSTGRRRQAYWCFAAASLLAMLSNLLQLLVPRTGDPSQIVPGDVVLTGLPLFHVASLSWVLATLLSGGTVVVPGRFEAGEFWSTVVRHGVTVAAVPLASRWSLSGQAV